MTLRLGNQDATEQRTEQDGHIGPHLDPGIAAHQFLGLQVLGHDAVLDRPKQGRMKAHHE